MEEAKKAIERTKLYALKYGQKLNLEQLYLRLISPKVFTKKAVIDFGERILINKENIKKLNLAKKFTENTLNKFEGILMVGVTGSVAAESAKENEDIDLLIVTKANELWWWRLYLRIYVFWNKIPHRKFKQKEKANDFCFNLWLDENNLLIPKNKQNLKNATDLIMMKVILNKNDSYQKFLKANKWTKKYLATGYEERRKNKTPLIPLDEGGQKFLLINYIKKIINSFLFGGQYGFMSLKGKKLRVSLGQAFFHEDN